MTQCDKIISYMKDNGFITPLDAIREFGILRLSARIWDIKHKGYKVRKSMQYGTNRYGDKVGYAKYTLEE